MVITKVQSIFQSLVKMLLIFNGHFMVLKKMLFAALMVFSILKFLIF